METSQAGLKFIQSFEGCSLSPYEDIGGTPTIGWGMTYYPDNDVAVTMADKPLTQPEADTYFISMVKPYCEGVIEALEGTVVNQNQLDSLVDFAYNLGVGAFKQSTLCQHVIGNCVAEQDFTIYDHVGQTVNNGLLARRKAEYNLYITPVVEAVPIIKPITINNNMIKFVKFYNSETKTYTTFFTENMTYAPTVETFEQPDLATVLAESTNECFIFWNGTVGGQGTMTQ